ncbi:hypothetical protein C488_19407 [Natrinema pellirubrum DSM 15624]|uniref:DUF4382 domain-containing protein n=1 Tax=Natrinema pellirubrum (strain DSM 15624 / CIP 106293 / JCM 10476 / NCIMB 786 / 157) TaxID=797303 RepID=L0JEU1_NATP1|nr:DUF4382 domain-containing protein [Natrinema pellirubrum]AGB30065.1 hypothetical protein Natpe_0123 [Natrinema pellirubrum DSM 15624]ELY70213.1 hypothetical protein C488_19407 [Natrinema pellirubrum DSM 15624]
MNRRTIQLVVVAALVAVAGCAGGMGGQPANESADGDSPMTDDSSGAMGTAAFYISDEPNVIDDFEHLNVTITKVGFKPAASGDGSSEPDGDSNETDGNETDDGSESTTSENETDSDEGWIEHDVDNRTVDLTELKGANASMIDEFDLPAGDYETVFIYVSDTEGVLTDGNETNVKLPSNKLKLNSAFTVGDNESIDFVYDIAPHKAGGSGKYVLKPVISQSGTGDDVEIRDVDKDEADEDDNDENRSNGDGNDGNGNGVPEANADD